MSYQIFALKWRPQNFDQIVGQDHAVNLLKNSIKKGRLAHAYLFAGPRGVGKTSTARILAKSLNCKNGPGVNPCQKCAPCREITQCRHLDVLEIDGASNRGIDEVRALREGVRFAPSGGRFKIYIIDEVHMLTNEAFNALLKTLEEPPEFVKFIFATTQANRIPATILSRCQRLDFRRIPMLEIINQLKRITAQEKIKLEDEVLFTIARASDGSLRDAESILDQLTSFSKEKISNSDVASLLGVLEQDVLFEITDKINNKDARGALDCLNTMLKQGKDSPIILRNIIEHFRNLIVAKISQADSCLIDLPQENIKKLFAQSQGFNLEEIFSLFNLLINAQEMCKRMESSIIPLEITLVKMAQEINKGGSIISPKPKAEQVPAEGKQGVNNQKTDLETNSISIERKESPEESEIFAAVQENWSKIIYDLSKKRMSLATFLSEGAPLKIENSTLTISFPEGCALHKDTLQKKENKLLFEKILSQFVQNNLRVKFIFSSTNGKKDAHDSFVHSVINVFNARLL